MGGGWGCKLGAESGIYMRGAPCIGEWSGQPRGTVPPGNKGFEELLDPNDNMKNVNKKKRKDIRTFSTGSAFFPS